MLRISSLLTAALLVSAVPALAGGFTFTDARCDPKNRTSTVFCIGHVRDATVEEIINGSFVNFDTFVELNRDHLPSDVTPKTVLPARTLYLAAT